MVCSGKEADLFKQSIDGDRLSWQIRSGQTGSWMECPNIAKIWLLLSRSNKKIVLTAKSGQAMCHEQFEGHDHEWPQRAKYKSQNPSYVSAGWNSFDSGHLQCLLLSSEVGLARLANPTMPKPGGCNVNAQLTSIPHHFKDRLAQGCTAPFLQDRKPQQ